MTIPLLQAFPIRSVWLRHRAVCTWLLLGLSAASLSAQSGYATGFENLTASASGTACAGQDGFYVPAVSGSIDGLIYTYAGNTLGIAANPNGGTKFFAGTSGGSSAFPRSQRAV